MHVCVWVYNAKFEMKKKWEGKSFWKTSREESLSFFLFFCARLQIFRRLNANLRLWRWWSATEREQSERNIPFKMRVIIIIMMTINLAVKIFPSCVCACYNTCVSVGPIVNQFTEFSGLVVYPVIRWMCVCVWLGEEFDNIWMLLSGSSGIKE